MTRPANDNARVICVTLHHDQRMGHLPYAINFPGGDQWCAASVEEVSELVPALASIALRERRGIPIKLLLEGQR